MIPFVKMHGAGNDFVCLDAVADPGLLRRDMPRLAAAMCDRHTGVGGDGLIVMSAPEPGLDLPEGRAVRMRMYNVDGSESAMCGNGIRCVARYALEHGLAETDAQRRLHVQTAAGVKAVLCNGAPGSVTVDMGPPVLELADVPVDRSRLASGEGPAWRVEAGGREYQAVFVSMGNPHAVIYVPDVAAIDLAAAGPALEHHPGFPQRMNSHFVEVRGPGEVVVRTWERGCGITGACGSGACAVCVAGVVAGRTGRSLLAHLPGGDLRLHWDQDTGHVMMTGPAVEVFSGQFRETGSVVA